jgi:hypothetical protein
MLRKPLFKQTCVFGIICRKKSFSPLTSSKYNDIFREACNISATFAILNAWFMKRQKIQRAFFIFAVIVLMFAVKLPAWAGGLPSAGIDYTLGDDATTSLRELQETHINQDSQVYTYTSPNIPAPNVAAIPTIDPNDDLSAAESEQVLAEETVTAVMEMSVREMERQLQARREEELFRNLVIAQVTN